MDFFARYKRVFLIIGFIIIVVLFGYLLYAMFLKPAPSEEIVTTPTATATPSRLPTSPAGEARKEASPSTIGGAPSPLPAAAPSVVANGGLTQTSELTATPTFGVTMDGSGSNLQYYNKDDGRFYSVDKNGNVTALSDKVFHNVEKVTWSPTKNKAILEYPDGANIVYDFFSKKQVTLPAHWKDFDFSPVGDKIVMKSIGLDPDNRWLAVSNTDGTKTRRIELIGKKDETVYPSWSPNNQSIAMYTEGVDFDRQEVYFVGLNEENFKSTVIEGRGFQSKWSARGDRLLYSVYSSTNDLKPILWVVNAQGDKIGSGRKSLGIETWADKCSFAGDFDLYCAVPETLEEGAGLFPEMAKTTVDRLYKINTLTGARELVAVPDRDFTMANIFVSSDNSYLYFTDEATKKLHKINLK